MDLYVVTLWSSSVVLYFFGLFLELEAPLTELKAPLQNFCECNGTQFQKLIYVVQCLPPCRGVKAKPDARFIYLAA